MRGEGCCPSREQDKFLLVMAMIQADFPMCTRLTHFHDCKAKKAFTYKKAKGKVKDLPAFIFHLIPPFPTSLCRASLDKPIITMPVFAYTYAYMHNWSPEALLMYWYTTRLLLLREWTGVQTGICSLSQRHRSLCEQWRGQEEVVLGCQWLLPHSWGIRKAAKCNYST